MFFRQRAEHRRDGRRDWTHQSLRTLQRERLEASSVSLLYSPSIFSAGHRGPRPVLRRGHPPDPGRRGIYEAPADFLSRPRAEDDMPAFETALEDRYPGKLRLEQSSECPR